MKNKPSIGQKLFSLNVGNACRRGTEQKLTPVVVKKSGSKYFVAGPGEGPNWGDTQYKIEDWCEKTDYCANSKLYESEQEWLDGKEAAGILDIIRDAFEHGGAGRKLSLETLRTIRGLIENDS